MIKALYTYLLTYCAKKRNLGIKLNLRGDKMTQPDFLENVRRELSAEELSGLRVYQANTDRGSVLFMPIIRGFGRQVQWTSRVHIKGAIGPLPATRASLKAIGAPDDWADKSRTFLDALQREYPAVPQAFPDRRSLTAGEL